MGTKEVHMQGAVVVLCVSKHEVDLLTFTCNKQITVMAHHIQEPYEGKDHRHIPRFGSAAFQRIVVQ